MITPAQITNAQIFTADSEIFIYKQKLLKRRLLFEKIAIFWVNYFKVINSWNEKFSGYF